MNTVGFLILILIGLALQVGLIALGVRIGAGKVVGELFELRKAVDSNHTLSGSKSNTVEATGRAPLSAPSKSNKCNCGFPADEPHAEWCTAATVTR